MQSTALLQSLKPRLQPTRWGLLAVFLLLSTLFRMMLGDPPSPGEIPHFFRGFLLLVGLVVFAPIPWQWTQDDRRKAPFFRGLAQALAWNPLWLGILLVAFSWLRSSPVIRISSPEHPGLIAFFRHLHAYAGKIGILAPLVGLVPIALLLGWFIATLQAAEGDRAEAVAARQTLEATARQAQEQALKAQLDPHVLYNALSGISELIREDAAKAEDAVVSLGELYRKLTALGAREHITLAEERSLVEDYLAVERVRLGPRLHVQWDWPEALAQHSLPPLLVQPLVENAIKHGLSPRKEGGTLRIAVAAEGAGLHVTVTNDGAPLNPDWQAGTGLSNLASRLVLLGQGSKLSMRQDGAWTHADLWLRPEGAP
jgi:hypothetical protein